MAKAVGRPLMPWQRQVVDVAFELMPDGLPAYRVVRVAVPRQSGKTTLILVLEVDRMTSWGPMQYVAYTAQDRIHARLKWEEQCNFLRTTVFRKAFTQKLAAGTERSLWAGTGSVIGIEASTETAGHGLTVDLAIVDEAWAQRDERLSASLRATMLTRRDAQEWWLSTMGTEDSVPWDDRVDDGRARVESQVHDPGARRGTAYFEWSAPDDADPYAEDTWWGCMPALGHTIDLDTIRTDARSLPEPAFRRGYLNQRTLGGQPVIPPGRWVALRDPGASVSPPLCFAADVTPDRSFGAIAAASGTGERTVVEVVDHRAGASWIPERLAELTARWQPTAVVVGNNSPAGAMAADLATLGLPVTRLEGGTYAGACGSFFDAVMDGTIAHHGQFPLDAAVAAARRRDIGDTWAWARRVGLDMTPLVAATLARWAVVSAPAPAVW